MSRLHMFIGKGGVGKSTCSSIAAMSMVLEGQSLLLDSMDPAHNLHDIFETKLGAREKRLLPKLMIRESDMEKMSREYMRDIQKEFKGLYHYQQALNIDKYFNILKYAPGMEEYAALLVLQRCFNDDRFDQIIIDTPPTALTLRMLALPSVNLHWIYQLIAMRKEIVDKKNGIARIRKENLSTLEEDPVYSRLNTMKSRYEHLQHMLEDAAVTEFVLVMNEDELSFSESIMIKEQIKNFGLNIHKVIINKSKQEEVVWGDRVKEAFPQATVEWVTMYKSEIRGIEMLKECSQQI